MQDFLFIFLQIRRDVPLGVRQRLLADVVSRDLLTVGVGDLDVVPEHVVETHLQRRNSGPFTFLLLQIRDPFFAAERHGAQ